VATISRHTISVAIGAAALAVFAGLTVASWGVFGAIGLVGLAIAAGAFLDLRVTLVAIIPVMILLPELPLAIPLRTEDLLMAPLTAAWLLRLAVTRDPWPRTPLNWPIFAVILVEFASLVFGVMRGSAELSTELYSSSFFFLKTIEVALLYFMVVYAIRDERDVRLFTYVFVASAAALGVWGVIEYGSGSVGEAITGPAGHGGYSLLGLTFVVLLAVLASLLVTRRTRAERVLIVVAALPVIYSLMNTFSRQSYVGAAAAVVTLSWVRNRWLILPAMLAVLALPFAAPDMVEQRATSIVTNAPDPATGRRPYGTRVRAIQRRAPEVMAQRPLLGFGPAALPPGFLDNQYLLTLYYTGLLGLAAFLWLLAAAVRTSYLSYHELTGDAKGLALAWLAATIGLAIAGFAGSPFVAVRVRQVYWFLAALVIAAVKVVRAREAADLEEEVAA
jgi:hypothetical protein